MKPIILSIPLVAASAATATAPIGLFDKWGGRFEEKIFSADQKLVGNRYQYNGAHASTVSIWRETSFSPWNQAGEPPPDYIKERGSTLRWDGTRKSGYNWYRWQDGTFEKVVVFDQPSEPPAPKYFWGHYEDADGSGRYTREGWSSFEIDNMTAHTHDVRLEVDWFYTSGMDHTTEDKFYVKDWELGGCFPMPHFVRYGWVEDKRCMLKRRP